MSAVIHLYSRNDDGTRFRAATLYRLANGDYVMIGYDEGGRVLTRVYMMRDRRAEITHQDETGTPALIMDASITIGWMTMHIELVGTRSRRPVTIRYKWWHMKEPSTIHLYYHPHRTLV